MKFSKIFISLLLFLNVSYAFAGVVDHFEVEFNKSETNIGEALDLTIKAVDENGETVTDYLGSVIGFSETDDEIELPTELSSDEGYTFKASDEGRIKFENGVIFHKEGEQELGIYDTDSSSNIVGLGRVKVNKKEIEKNYDIEILSPEQGITIGDNKIKVSGKTVKNHNIKILINNNKEYSTISNTQGIFEKNIQNLENGENSIQAFVLDADGNNIGSSETKEIRVDNNFPIFKKIVLAPLSKEGEIDEGKNIIVNLYATPNLNDVKIIINDQIIKLEENEQGVYTGNFNSPKGGKSYDISAILKDNLGHTTTEKDIAQIKVNKVELMSAQPETNTTNTGTKDECDNIDLTIKGLKLVELKNKSILTWDKVEKADGYKVFKKNEDGTLSEVADTDKEVFEVKITGDKIKYSLFAVKAYKNCKKENGTGTITKVGDLSEATKIKTGPEMIILLLLSLLLGAGFILIKRTRA